jgi:hypothetical protein
VGSRLGVDIASQSVAGAESCEDALITTVLGAAFHLKHRLGGGIGNP